MIFIILLFPLKIKVLIDLSGYEIKIYNLKIYKNKFLEIKDINKEKDVINYLRIFKVIDIQSVNLEIGGISDYYYRAINYRGVHILFNLLSFAIKDQFIFNYDLEFYGPAKFNFKCIIKSNMGKIILGLLRRRRK